MVNKGGWYWIIVGSTPGRLSRIAGECLGSNQLGYTKEEIDLLDFLYMEIHWPGHLKELATEKILHEIITDIQW